LKLAEFGLLADENIHPDAIGFYAAAVLTS
jgi:hypothetical protein